MVRSNVITFVINVYHSLNAFERGVDVKRVVFVSTLFLLISVVTIAANFEDKVLSVYGEYVRTFNTYISMVEKTGELNVRPTNKIDHAVYTIVSELGPVAYYRWIRMRSFQIPSGAVGNFQKVDMQYISKSLYERYKTKDPVENLALSAFLVYVDDDLYRQNVGPTDFPQSPTFSESAFALVTDVSKYAAALTQVYIQKSLGAPGDVMGNYSYLKVDLKKLFAESLSKIYGGSVPKSLSNALEKFKFNVPPANKVRIPSELSGLVYGALDQKEINDAIGVFKLHLSKVFDNSARNMKLFISMGQTPSEVVKRVLSSVNSSLKFQELLAANTVKRTVSRRTNNRLLKLENKLAAQSKVPTSPLIWRWLIYALVLVFFLFFRFRLVKYVFLSILVFESLVILLEVDPMLNRFDSTLYGFLVIMVAFLSMLSWFGILKSKKILFVISSTAVMALFISLFFVPLYVNLPSTRMSKNNKFLKSVYVKIYENEIYGQNGILGILSYHLNNMSSNLTALRLAPYNFVSQTLSSCLSNLKREKAYRGIIEYPAALRISLNRNSSYFGYGNEATSLDMIKIVRDRANMALSDIRNNLKSISNEELAFSNTVDGIYALAAPTLRNNISEHVENRISSSNLKEIGAALDGILKKANMMPERAPNVFFFQTRDGSKLFILVALLLISITFFGRNWIYRFVISIITVIGSFMLLIPRAVEIFVEYGFPTYSHVLQRGEEPNVIMIWIVAIVGVFVACEALYTHFSGKKHESG